MDYVLKTIRSQNVNISLMQQLVACTVLLVQRQYVFYDLNSSLFSTSFFLLVISTYSIRFLILLNYTFLIVIVVFIPMSYLIWFRIERCLKGVIRSHPIPTPSQRWIMDLEIPIADGIIFN